MTFLPYPFLKLRFSRIISSCAAHSTAIICGRSELWDWVKRKKQPDSSGDCWRNRLTIRAHWPCLTE